MQSKTSLRQRMLMTRDCNHNSMPHVRSTKLKATSTSVKPRPLSGHWRSRDFHQLSGAVQRATCASNCPASFEARRPGRPRRRLRASCSSGRRRPRARAPGGLGRAPGGLGRRRRVQAHGRARTWPAAISDQTSATANTVNPKESEATRRGSIDIHKAPGLGSLAPPRGRRMFSQSSIVFYGWNDCRFSRRSLAGGGRTDEFV